MSVEQRQEIAMRELYIALKGLIESVEKWSAAVETIIGREPKTGIDPSLARAKSAVMRAKEFYIQRELPKSRR